ncbi:hypothetical protein BGW80DRAFT_1338312 [Lactifluus volemus]|nr:hypothetical protein BGW80DRAFT_1338312 [Lactifluus volemus]
MTLSQRGTLLQMRLRVLCMGLDWQLSCLAEIFAELYLIVRDVQNLYINEIPSDSVQDDVDPSPLLELLRPFTNVKEFIFPEQVALHVRYILEQEGLLQNARVTVTPPTRLRRQRRRRSPIYTPSSSESMSPPMSPTGRWSRPTESSIPSLPDFALLSPT